MERVRRELGLKVAAAGVLPPLVVGLLVMRAHGAATALLAINVAAATIGMLLVFAAGERLAALVAERPAWLASVVLGLQACTLAVPGLDGVQRWVSWGPIRLHLAAIFEPLLLLATVVLWLRGRAWMAISFVAVGLGLHVAQPDAGQATALAAGASALALLGGVKWGERLAMLAIVVAGALFAWLRPDPLPPADFVEDIVPRAFELHFGVGVLALVALAPLPAAAAASPASRGVVPALKRAPALAVALYLSANIVVVSFGEFPTPVLGFGASPILGALLGLGLLAPMAQALSRRVVEP